MRTAAIILTCLMLGGCASQACKGNARYVGQVSTLTSPASPWPRSGMTANGQLYYDSGDVTTIWKQDGSTDYIYH